MSLRAHFDNALEKGGHGPGTGRRQAPAVTIKSGKDAAQRLQMAQASLKKIRAQRERRKQQA
jgi:hypothetical protein